MPWTVYIIQTSSGKFYTGITTNLQRRFFDHKYTKKGARFFHTSSPKEIVFEELYPNRSEASKREAAIKKMNRAEKQLLIMAKKNSPLTNLKTCEGMKTASN